MKHAAAISAVMSMATPLAGATAQTLSPTSVFEADTITPAKNGAAQPLHISVQAWGIAGQSHATHEIPLRGFYVAHLISGHIAATMDGQTAEHLPGDYWTVKAGGAMQVKTLGQVAVLETTVVTKQ